MLGNTQKLIYKFRTSY